MGDRGFPDWPRARFCAAAALAVFGRPGGCGRPKLQGVSAFLQRWHAPKSSGLVHFSFCARHRSQARRLFWGPSTELAELLGLFMIGASAVYHRMTSQLPPPRRRSGRYAPCTCLKQFTRCHGRSLTTSAPTGEAVLLVLYPIQLSGVNMDLKNLASTVAYQLPG
jgi:hypothetical protein